MPHRVVARRILESAAELFALRGFRATTTRDIAAHAQVNQTTIFRQYKKGKYELSLAAIAYLAEASGYHSRIKNVMQECDPTQPQTMETFIAECLTFIESHLDFVMILRNGIMEKSDIADSRDLQAEVHATYTAPLQQFVYSFCSASIAQGKMVGDPVLNAEILFGIMCLKVHLYITYHRYKKLDGMESTNRTSQDGKALARKIVQRWLYGCANYLTEEPRTWERTAVAP